MRLVTRDQIKLWGRSNISKGQLPAVISKLIRATTAPSTYANFPAGSAVTIGGWDGVVNCDTKTSYVPEGTSSWELGTTEDAKGKAQRDYDKRKKNPLGLNPKETTYIAVTTEPWDSTDWVTARKSENFWKDVKVYNCEDIEQWFEYSPAVSRDFLTVINNRSADGILTSKEYWDYFSIGPDGMRIPHRMLTEGREIAQASIKSFLENKPEVHYVKASSKDEAIAFIVASAAQFPNVPREAFDSKCLILENVDQFRQMAGTGRALNLIPKFENPQSVHWAVSRGHHVLVPLGPSDSVSTEVNPLPIVSREAWRNGLESMGLSSVEANRQIRDTARIITFLKDRLKFEDAKVDWDKKDAALDLLPAMLVGRWDEDKVGDIELIESIAGTSYETYAKKIIGWTTVANPPLLKIGSTWRLSSPIIVWGHLSKYLSHSDLKLLSESFAKALLENTPVTEDTGHAFFQPVYKYSNWLQEGLCQSLILVTVFGESLQLPSGVNPQQWVDQTVKQILVNKSGEDWKKINSVLPLIAEASPDTFITAVQDSLNSPEKSIMELFVEAEGLMGPSSNHTGLLWALEGLAWMPDYLSEVAVILARLASLDPGGNLANRPNNSLKEIFKPWHYQTFATLDERMKVIKTVVKKEPKVGWNLLVSLLPQSHDIGHPTRKLRWRFFEHSYDRKVTFKELHETNTRIVNTCLEEVGTSGERMAQLLKQSAQFRNLRDIELALHFAKDAIHSIDDTNAELWHTLRKLLAHHRAHPNTEWSFSEDQLEPYQELLDKCTPSNPVQKYGWLFDNDWPEFPDAIVVDLKNMDDYRKEKEVKISEARDKALHDLYELGEVDEILRLEASLENSWYLGKWVAQYDLDASDVRTILERLKSNDDNDRFIFSFLSQKFNDEGLEWFENWYNLLESESFDDTALGRFLAPMFGNLKVWRFVESLNPEVQNKYWELMNPTWTDLPEEDVNYQIQKLLDSKRFFSAVQTCFYGRKLVKTELAVLALKKAATEKASEQKQFHQFEIEQVIDMLRSREDASRNDLMQLELLYLPILDSYGSKSNFQVLEEELSTNPESFIEVLKWMYKPNDEKIAAKESEDDPLTDEMRANRGHNAYRLLSTLSRIPGTQPNGDVNFDLLNSWVDAVRTMATEVGRSDPADSHIGKLLAEYPISNDDPWPPEEICEIIESIGPDSVLRGFSTALFNQRGSSTRRPEDGGDIERGHAEFFKKLADANRVDHPKIAKQLRELSIRYLEDAKRMDEDAERIKLEY